IPLSVWFGRRAKRRRKYLVAVLVNVAVVIAAWSIVADATARYEYAAVGSYDSQPFLHHADGAGIANICPYSSDGKLLSGVLLFDENGRPIIDTAENLNDGRPVAPAAPLILNAYPRALVAPNLDTGAPEPV